jgi:aminoglycoside phosphotransferase family enzyme/predicted kinase
VSKISGDQQDVVAFLGEPASYAPGVGQVERIETHISLVFLAGDRAYKLKRAVKYPYLDFSTTAKRRVACDRELALNRRTAPELYLEVRGISRGPDGAIRWSGDDSALDCVVVMRRFQQALLLDALAEQGGLTAAMMRDLVEHIAVFHARAEPLLDRGGAVTIAAIEAENDECLHRAGGRFLSASDIAELHQRSRAWLDHVASLLDARRAAGKVRHCHGDLHLRNICLLAGKPVLFDCLEFSEEMASIDVLYDLAFLMMDLEHRGLEEFASLVANRYFDLTDEEGGLAALPLFLAMRAAIRAHVVATTAAAQDGADNAPRQEREAQSYLDLALALLVPVPCRLIAIGGLSGTGKSTIAQRLAPLLGLRPGARVLRSDVIRKRLCGVAPETRLPPTAYTADMSRRVYDAIRDKAAAALQSGYCAIIDAVSLTSEERSSFAAIAATARVPFSGIWLSAPTESTVARLDGRRDDASDATPQILEQQLRHDPGFIDWVRVDVGTDRDTSFAAVRQALGLT